MFGTSVALYDYAYHCKHLYGIECSILYNQNHAANNDMVIDKFKKEFEVNSYSDLNQMQDIIEGNKSDAFFMIKSGNYDGVISKSCKNWILAVAPYKNTTYGDKFFMASKWLSKVSNGIDFVPHMVNLPDVKEDLRENLGIPKGAIVFGRNGGYDSFDINFAKKAVIDVLEKKKDIYFLFQGTNKFVEHERVIHLPSNSDLYEKVRFINSCDALLHARFIGESFGLTIAEFSSKNKPVITWMGNHSGDRNHIESLGDKGIYYNDYDELMNILLKFEPDDTVDWDCYRDCYPKPVMEKFIKLYLS
jgi:hypothetical protein